MSDKPRISIVGLGRLGTPIAVCFALRGFEVIGYDPVPEKVDAVNARRAPGYEPELKTHYEKVGDRLRATTDLVEAVRGTDVTFVAVPTPGAPDGSSSLEFLTPILRQIGEALRDVDRKHTVAVLSTVMPGSTKRRLQPTLEKASGKTVGVDIGLCYAAVFATVGNVVSDFLKPDMAIVGQCAPSCGDKLEQIYKEVCLNDPPVIRMTPFNAELTKLAVNVFVTTKISFANLLARLCEEMPGGNIDVVTGAMQIDRRIGQGAMCGAVAYGGPFFARDNSAFGSLMRRLNVAPKLAEEMAHFNRAQVPWLADLVQENLPNGGTAGVLGLSYKPNTDICTLSASINLCQALSERNVPVLAHDPAAMGGARETLPPTILFAETAEACVRASDLVVLSTPWAAYRDLPREVWSRGGNPRVVVDCWRIVPFLQGQEGVTYIALGVGPGTAVDPEGPGSESPAFRKGCGPA